MKIDYKFKSEVLKTDIPKLANQISKAIYAQFALENYGEIIKTNMDYDTAMKTRCFLLEKYPREYAEAEKINLARYKRVARLRKRINAILHNSEYVQFITLTFNDDTLAKTSPETRRKYVQRYLTELGCDYVGNIDFGAKNGREHYHAVIADIGDREKWEKYGFYSALFVKAGNERLKKVPKRYQALTEDEIENRMQEDNEKALAKYVAKLTNHAIKETTKRSCILYPKKAKRKQKPYLIPIEEDIESPFENDMLDLLSLGDGV